MRCPGMYFNIAGTFCSCDIDPCIEKIRAGIAVIFTWMDNNYFIIVIVNKGIGIIQSILPQIMKEFFFHFGTSLNETARI
jgi:hypothetical protein